MKQKEAAIHRMYGFNYQRSGATLTLSSTNNKSIYVYGDIVVNARTIVGSHAKLVLYGSGTKSISGTPIDVTSVFLFSRNGSD